MTAEGAIQTDPGAVTRGAASRKRALSSIEPTLPPDDGAPRKRPCRATKETWKAREAREAREEFEAKRSRTSLKPHRKKQTLFVGRNYGRGEVDHRVADVED